jgi:deoxyadenosine/deoxycytidine kinase
VVAGEKMNSSIKDVVEVIGALIQIAICRFMVKRPDCWDTISCKWQRLKKKMNHRNSEYEPETAENYFPDY